MIKIITKKETNLNSFRIEFLFKKLLFFIKEKRF